MDISKKWSPQKPLALIFKLFILQLVEGIDALFAKILAGEYVSKSL
jgi:hypothetical protein